MQDGPFYLSQPPARTFEVVWSLSRRFCVCCWVPILLLGASGPAPSNNYRYWPSLLDRLLSIDAGQPNLPLAPTRPHFRARRLPEPAVLCLVPGAFRLVLGAFFE